MRNKVMVLIITGILTVGGISVAYATSKTDTSFNASNKTMMSTQNNDTKSSYNYGSSMMDVKNKDFNSMNNLMTNMSDSDYKK